MKRTHVTTLLILGVLGSAAGAITELLLVANGRPIVSLPITLGIALSIIGAVVVTMALPIRKMTKVASAPRVDPFYATRIVMLAKACALTGALGVGVGAGVLAYLLTRSIIGAGSVLQAIITLAGAAVLLAGGLVAEHMCRIPPSDDDNESGKDPVQA